MYWVVFNEVGIVLGFSELDMPVVCLDAVCLVVFNEISMALLCSEFNIALASRDVVFNEADIMLECSELDMVVVQWDVCPIVVNEDGIVRVFDIAVACWDVVCLTVSNEVSLVLRWSELVMVAALGNVVCSVCFNEVDIACIVLG